MFVRKKEFKRLDEIVEKLNAQINTDGRPIDGYLWAESLVTAVKTLKKENIKLKAIVAELCDYVYKDNKGEK